MFDFVFLIEAIEHLTDDYLESTIKEIMRILKPNGKIMITTPNNENLELGNVCCPDCGAIFHKMQHVQSFNKDVLIGLMQNIGFRTIFCKNINFADYKQFSLKRELGRLARFLKNSQKRKPHLVFVGEKK